MRFAAAKLRTDRNTGYLFLSLAYRLPGAKRRTVEVYGAGGPGVQVPFPAAFHCGSPPDFFKAKKYITAGVKTPAVMRYGEKRTARGRGNAGVMLTAP
jgi:hypothetical protein